MARLNIEAVNKWLTAGASIAVIIGVFVTIGGVLVATRSLEQTQGAASATLVLNLRDKLDRYAKITSEIQNNGSAHGLMKERGGKFRDIDVEQYISNFEDIGYLVREGVIARQIAYAAGQGPCSSSLGHGG
jgi:hypothetical protein